MYYLHNYSGNFDEILTTLQFASTAKYIEYSLC